MKDDEIRKAQEPKFPAAALIADRVLRAGVLADNKWKPDTLVTVREVKAAVSRFKNADPKGGAR